MKKKKQEISFEEGLRELESIVEKLERGDLSLEESYDLFERGIKIVRFCQAKLEEIEKKVELLVKENTEVSLQEYDEMCVKEANDAVESS